ncbi:hypothetical protein FG877_10605 [Enterococcus casseliflavus]|nr:hypothetical protein [Enterococcus casseliflavus]
MFKRYTKEFKETILSLYNHEEFACQFSLKYDLGYSTVLKIKFKLLLELVLMDSHQMNQKN